MISFTTSGSTKRTDQFLSKMQNPHELYSELNAIAQQGVVALQAATPVDTGETSQSWGYEIEISGETCTIAWTNTHKNGQTHVAVLLQYGHGTGTGGYVAGQDFINPALKPIFDQLADQVWKKVTSA